MSVTIPLLLLVAVVGYFALKLYRPPTWLVVLLLLGGFLLADSFLAPAIESGTRTGVEVINDTTK